MTKIESPKQYDLEERTLKFAQETRIFVKLASHIPVNLEYCKQLIRSSGSTGANYIEANESLSKKDFLLRIKICRKEAKETTDWLKLIDTESSIELEQSRRKLLKESTELMMIFGAIMRKSV